MTERKAKPIIFSGEMVRAILDGRKSQTRRIAKLPSEPKFYLGMNGAGDHVFPPSDSWGGQWRSPYAPGDRLWVRETISAGGWDPPIYRLDETEKFGKGQADQNNRWTPAIFMPRWASRITLAVTDVRVERLNDISEDDARAEGVELTETIRGRQCWHASHRVSFSGLWSFIHGPGSWDANPWVVAISFKRIEQEPDHD